MKGTRFVVVVVFFIDNQQYINNKGLAMSSTTKQTKQVIIVLQSSEKNPQEEETNQTEVKEVPIEIKDKIIEDLEQVAQKDIDKDENKIISNYIFNMQEEIHSIQYNLANISASRAKNGLDDGETFTSVIRARWILLFSIVLITAHLLVCSYVSINQAASRSSRSSLALCSSILPLAKAMGMVCRPSSR